MSKAFTADLYLPAQAATETEATILKWHVAEGDPFKKGSVLAEAESAKSSFEFEAPCDGKVLRLLCAEGDTVLLEDPVLQVETTDPAVKGGRTAVVAKPLAAAEQMAVPDAAGVPSKAEEAVSILGIGGYIPDRVVRNAELLREFPDMSEDYLFGVTGIRERRWANGTEKPSDMAHKAASQAIEKSGLDAKQIGAIVVSTTTPDVVMPSTACILQQKLGLRGIASFDINAACSGWLYAISVAKGLTLAGIADNVLVVGVDVQSQLLDCNDKVTYFLFGDGAGATIVSRGRKGHAIKSEVLVADARGMQMARRDFPGYRIPGDGGCDPWIRLDGHALFKFATTSFSSIIRDVVAKSGWEPDAVRWVVPHQANGRILKAAAARSGIPFERFYLNIERVGNTSSASIPLALTEMDKGMQPGDKLVLCSVGAGITAAALSVEW